MEKGREIWYYHYDGHESTRLLTDEAGQTTDRYAYDAYGNLMQKEGDTENGFVVDFAQIVDKLFRIFWYKES